jgi:negative regulator of flagellin synthesis FlgM
MKVVSGIPTPGVAAATPVSEAARTDAATPATASRPAGGDALQSAALQPALDALRQLPDVDHAKVAALRDALAKGDLPFDPAKLAALIERYHRGVK